MAIRFKVCKKNWRENSKFEKKQQISNFWHENSKLIIKEILGSKIQSLEKRHHKEKNWNEIETFLVIFQQNGEYNRS